MAAVQSRYTPLSQAPEDSIESSPHDTLLPTMSMIRLPKDYSITTSPSLVLRVIASILSLTTFIILVVDGGDAFIASDIFVMLILILDLLMILHHCVSDVFKVTVEVRQQPWGRELGSHSKTKVSRYFDCGLSACLLISLIIGNAVVNRYWDGARKGGVIVGYVVIVIQFLLAAPVLDNMALSIKLYETRGNIPLDTKRSDVVDESAGGPSRRRTPEGEERTSSAEDLV